MHTSLLPTPAVMLRSDDEADGCADDFFRAGHRPMCECVAPARHCWRAACVPSPVCWANSSIVCSFFYHFHHPQGASSGVFYETSREKHADSCLEAYVPASGCNPWPVHACCPLFQCDCFACCCRPPQDRCAAWTYAAQHVLTSGAADAPRLWPLPGPGEPPSRGFLLWLTSLLNAGSSMLACRAPLECCVRLAVAPHVSLAAASPACGLPSAASADHHADFGGMWAYPRGGALPTPPLAEDAAGRPLPSNVPPGPAGSRVVMLIGGGPGLSSQAYSVGAGLLLAERTGQVVLLPAFPSAADAPFPAALDSLTRSYRRLCRWYGAANVLIVADSLGCSHALALLLRAAERGLPKPAALALLSPWLDCRVGAAARGGLSSEELNAARLGGFLRYGRQDYLPAETIDQVNAAHATAEQAAADPLANPALATAEALRGALPSTYVTYGGDEVLRSQAEALVARLEAAGRAGPNSVHVAEGMPHDYLYLGVLAVSAWGCCGGAEAGGGAFQPNKGLDALLAWLASIDGGAWVAPSSGGEARRAALGSLPAVN